MRLVGVVGARPNFVKMAPVIEQLKRRPDKFDVTLVHTGQHYDANMSAVFFEELGLPEPDLNLEVGSGSHAVQTADVLVRCEEVMRQLAPAWVLVPGDVNSTLAAALAATKLGIRVAHVEAGLRSFDRRMPEEINRVLTDHISDLLFTSCRDADRNLLREGIDPGRIHFVGNAMIDTLRRALPAASARWPGLSSQLQIDRYALVTLHRPSNVDDPAVLAALMRGLERVSTTMKVLFAVHPRTRNQLAAVGDNDGRIQLLDPPGYLDFLALQAHAAVVLTDSGGIQEETTVLGVPCLTLRENTERPITITEGTNRLVRADPDDIAAAVHDALSETRGPRVVPELWDGRTAERIVQILEREA